MSARLMERKLRMSKGSIARWMREKSLSIPRPIQNKLRGEAMRGRTSSTPAQDKFIRKNYMTMPLKRMADNINRSHCFVGGRMRQLGLVTPLHIRQKFKADSQIKKGNISHNKGKTWDQIMSRSSQKRSLRTCFKKGNLPHNTKYDRCIVIRSGHPKRNEPSYKWVRISKANWQMLHVNNWIRKYGPVPKGFIVVFKGKDTMNCEVSNLQLITRKENMLRNTIHRYPDDLIKTIRMLGKLKRKIISHGKK